MILSQYTQEPHPMGGARIVPRVIVVHYTATQTRPRLPMPGTLSSIRWHFTIDLDGSVFQHLGIGQRGAHAGDSNWLGAPSVNGFSVGIEIVNPGPVWLRAGRIVDIHGKPWTRTGSVVARHELPACEWTRWAEYTDEQVDAAARLCAEIVTAAPSISAIVGHSEISLSGKIDPGPAFPLTWLRETVFPGAKS